MMSLHRFWTTRTGFHGFANPFFIDTAADANDHENDLQLVGVFVKNDSQLGLEFLTARNGWQITTQIGTLSS